MSVLRQKMIEDMQLKGLAVRTQEAYVNAVLQLSKRFKKSPDNIDEEELREYFLYLKNEKQVADSTFSIALCGIKFFYEQTLKKEWHTLQLVRPDRKKKLPVVFSIDEVKRVLDCVHRWQYQVCLNTIYACGLRLLEGTRLHVKDIDSDRKMLHVVAGKGGKDRYVPLPDHTLMLLRHHWVTHRNPDWMFPSRNGHGPMDESGNTESISSSTARERSPQRCLQSIPCVIRMPRICWKQGSICASSRSISVMPLLPPPPFTPISLL